MAAGCPSAAPVRSAARRGVAPGRHPAAPASARRRWRAGAAPRANRCPLAASSRPGRPARGPPATWPWPRPAARRRPRPACRQERLQPLRPGRSVGASPARPRAGRGRGRPPPDRAAWRTRDRASDRRRRAGRVGPGPPARRAAPAATGSAASLVVGQKAAQAAFDAGIGGRQRQGGRHFQQRDRATPQHPRANSAKVAARVAWTVGRIRCTWHVHACNT